MVFSFYSNLYQLHAEKTVSMRNVYGLLTGSRLRHLTGEIRRNLAEGNAAEADRLKMKLPAIAVSCLFPLDRRTEQAGGYTGEVLVDVDDLPMPALTFQKQCESLPFVRLAHVSAGGSGVHLFIPVDSDAGRHIAACRSLYDFFTDTFGVTPDVKCTDLTRTALLCYAPDCFYNPHAVPWHTEEASEVQPSGMPPAPDSFPSHEAAGGMPASALVAYLDKADQSLAWTKGQRHSNLVSLASCLNRAGFGETEVTAECLRRYARPDFGEKEISKTISSIYVSGRAGHGCNRKDFVPFATAVRLGESVKSVKDVNDTPAPGEPLASGPEHAGGELIEGKLHTFPDSVYEGLPDLLTDIIRPDVTGKEKDMLLVGALTLLSSVACRVTGSYRGETEWPTLYGCLIAPPGSGKGRVNGLKAILGKFHEYIYVRSRREVREYERKREMYDIAMGKFRKSGQGTMPEPPDEVCQKDLDLQGDISKARLIEQITANEHYISLMMESEIGVLVTAIQQDYGKYTFLLNEVYHHECLSKNTKKDGKKSAVHPLLSMMLTGTFGQFLNFVPTSEDGLFSRILGYVSFGAGEWSDLTDADDTPEYANYFASLASRVLEVAIHLDESATFVHYSHSQRCRLNVCFRNVLKRVQMFTEDELSGLVYRFGLMHFRLCMLLTALRKGESKWMDKELTVRDDDYQRMLDVILVCLDHMLVVSTMQRKEKAYQQPVNPTRGETLFNNLPADFLTSDALLAGTGFEMSESTVKRMLVKWEKGGLIHKISHGKYHKMSN